MNVAVKVAGIIICVLSATLFGFLKGVSLKSRVKKLRQLSLALDTLYEHINYGEIPLEEALKKSFYSCDFIKLRGFSVTFQDSDFDAEERQIINEFFVCLGRSGKKAECERIKATAAILRKKEIQANNTVAEKAKLWQTGGVCIGLTIGILLI